MDPRNKSWVFFLFLLFFFFSSKTHLTIAVDIISVGDSLTGSKQIVSKDGIFVLGFFRPGKSLNYYIGIWYKKIPVQTVVWVANRDKPLTNSTPSELKLLESGNLVIYDQSKTQIWSTQISSNRDKPLTNSSEAVLGDDGNLILRDKSNPSTVIWQSFDHPTDTWLSGGKLGFNKKTNQSQRLISWKNSEDPSPGIYSLEFDPRGNKEFMIQWNRSERVWSSGTWNGHIFSLVPEMRLNYIYNFSYISNDNESYFTWSVYNKSIITREVMGLSGQIQQYTWSDYNQQWNLFWSQPKSLCDVYGICGSFGTCNQDTSQCDCLQGFKEQSSKEWNLRDSTGGCVRKNSLACQNKDAFQTISNVVLPVKPQNLVVQSFDECKSACTNKCSCKAYAFANNRCSIWDGDLLNLQQKSSGGDSLYLKLSTSDVKTSEVPEKKSSVTMVVVGAVIGVVAVLLLAIVLIWRWKVKRSRGTSKTVEGSLVAFTYRDLLNATKNFSQKLGGGGFGSVYKGMLPNSTVIAVKKLEGLSQGEKQFRSEVSTIGTIQHVNLVRLRGFCSEGAKRLLVYDFMPKGSLDSHLFNPKDTENLDWKTRYQIAVGTARGLAYLHEKCRDCIIHCDIKPENILLDAEFFPKVADFGLAKLVGRDFSRVLTTLRGTRGYLAPEWISGVAITAKADVYSYGMMLFEIISGRRNSEHSKSNETFRFFPIWVATKMNEGAEIISLVDNRLEGNANIEELTRACRVACWCIQDDEANRPSTGQIVQMLEGVLVVNVPPIPRSLHVLVENQDNAFFFSESSDRSLQPRSNTSSPLLHSHAKSSVSSLSSESRNEERKDH